MTSDTSNNKGKLILQRWMKPESEWAPEATKREIIPVFVGNDLKNYKDDGSLAQSNVSTPKYLSLMLATESTWSVLPQQDRLDLRKTFLEDLQDWKWSDEDEHEIFLQSDNVKLSIGSFYQDDQSQGGDGDYSIKTDISKLLAGQVQSEEGDHSSALAVSCGDESNLKDAQLSHAGCDATLSLDVSGKTKLWTLKGKISDNADGTERKGDDKARGGSEHKTMEEAGGAVSKTQERQDALSKTEGGGKIDKTGEEKENEENVENVEKEEKDDSRDINERTPADGMASVKNGDNDALPSSNDKGDNKKQ
ncbi:hypothetical protein ACHAO7_011924 [Fusarium culmorum]